VTLGLRVMRHVLELHDATLALADGDTHWSCACRSRAGLIRRLPPLRRQNNDAVPR
jgi:hypothetical protein